ncbi:hypothetical protein ANCDUO_18965, partial [Ancylostoma duodenale]
IQITSLCMCISLSGTVALVCFFAPKRRAILSDEQEGEPAKKKKNLDDAVFAKFASAAILICKLVLIALATVGDNGRESANIGHYVAIGYSTV